MSTSKELVGPIRFVHFGPFGERGRVAYKPPRHTGDLRYDFCLEHRTACDCREAEMAEKYGEVLADLRRLEQAARSVLSGHRTWDWSGNEPGSWRGNGPGACRCHGCQIVRAAFVPPVALGGDYRTGIIQPPVEAAAGR